MLSSDAELSSADVDEAGAVDLVALFFVPLVPPPLPVIFFADFFVVFVAAFLVPALFLVPLFLVPPFLVPPPFFVPPPFLVDFLAAFADFFPPPPPFDVEALFFVPLPPPLRAPLDFLVPFLAAISNAPFVGLSLAQRNR